MELIQTYQNEICPQLVYLGRREHAVNSQVVKDLKIRAYVNCTKHDDFMLVFDFYNSICMNWIDSIICRVKNEDSRKYFRVPIDDIHDTKNISELLRDAVNFICKLFYLYFDDFFSKYSNYSCNL